MTELSHTNFNGVEVNKIGSMITRYISSSKKSKTLIANETGITPSALSNWQRGMFNPALMTLNRFCASVGIQMRSFIERWQEESGIVPKRIRRSK